MMVVMMMMIMMMMMVIMTMKPTKCSIAWRSWLTEKYFSGAWHKQAEHAPGASGFECWMVVDAQHTFGEPGGKWKTPDMLNHCVTFLEQTNCKTNNTSGNYRCKIHHVTSIPLFFLNGYFPCFIHMFIHYIYVNKDNYIYNYIYTFKWVRHCPPGSRAAKQLSSLRCRGYWSLGLRSWDGLRALICPFFGDHCVFIRYK